MKATVVSVFRNKDYVIQYWYHNVKKCNDDVEDISAGNAFVPMMEIKLWKDKLETINDKWVEVGSQIVFAPPKVVKKYTGLDMFEAQLFYRFYGRALNIEFEWVEESYPYLRVYHPRDYITTEKYRFPRVTFIEDTRYDW